MSLCFRSRCQERSGAELLRLMMAIHSAKLRQAVADDWLSNCRVSAGAAGPIHTNIRFFGR